MPVPFSTLLTAAALTVGLGPPLPAAASGPRSGGAWGWPLPGPPVVARPFQPPVTRWGAGHRGVDLAAAPGATVFTAGPGVVSFAGYVAGVGVVSIVHAGGLRTTYEPVAPSVAAGQAVARGSPIGRLIPGHAGCPAAGCLHWGLRRGDTYLDPLLLLRPPLVRLLPWRGAADPG
jgi:murein DD-endopeptidase MepM/ murein hydrolase activator NlpD